MPFGRLTLYSDTDLGFSLVRIEAKYLENGFGISRLIPVYEPSFQLQLFPEAGTDDLGDENRRLAGPFNGASQKAFNNDSHAIPPKDLEQDFHHDDEIWSRLPAWAKILDDLRRKARKT